MKKILFVTATVLFSIISFVMSSCSNDDDNPSAAKPVAALAEVGEENCKEGVIGKDLHLEGDLVAEGLIARIDVTIASADGKTTIVTKSWTDGKYIGVKN
ncbi:MAG TPA: hypothetical protein DEQ27_03480, partial [Prevotella sp.]|nr:hypothetical protein [Prevotella sp.]